MIRRKIEDVEGIGTVMGETLRAAGIKNTDTLLIKCRTSKDRKSLAKRTGLKEAQILKFANMADLFRIKGVGKQFAELLEAAGVDTIPELAQRDPENLTKAMADLNEKKSLVRRVPFESEVARWIHQAKFLPRVILY
jgi:predicted flap endonuclease-1-like 5' DNA nuclease